MRRLVLAILACAVMLTSTTPMLADRFTKKLREVEGWTIISVTQVDGKFLGCDYDRVIKFQDGTSYKCAGYGYEVEYEPDAVIFGKSMKFQGKNFVDFKALIEGEFYAMKPVPLKTPQPLKPPQPRPAPSSRRRAP